MRIGGRLTGEQPQPKEMSSAGSSFATGFQLPGGYAIILE